MEPRHSDGMITSNMHRFKDIVTKLYAYTHITLPSIGSHMLVHICIVTILCYMCISILYTDLIAPQMVVTNYGQQNHIKILILRRCICIQVHAEINVK